MCHYKVITSTSFGCVVKCNNCNQLHLGFGNTVLLLSPEEFSRFSANVYSIHQEHFEEKLLSKEKIYLHTDSRRITLAFNTQEWLQLQELLGECSLALQIDEIFGTL